MFDFGLMAWLSRALVTQTHALGGQPIGHAAVFVQPIQQPLRGIQCPAGFVGGDVTRQECFAQLVQVQYLDFRL